MANQNARIYGLNVSLINQALAFLPLWAKRGNLYLPHIQA